MTDARRPTFYDQDDVMDYVARLERVVEAARGHVGCYGSGQLEDALAELDAIEEARDDE